MISFFIEGRFMGSSPPRLVESGRDWGRPLSLLVYCGQCGDAWARIAVDGSRWTSQFSICRRCAPEHDFQVPGSLWNVTWLIDAFPDAVLRWELERHLDLQEKEYGKTLQGDGGEARRVGEGIGK